jgi:hypothetical protein
VSTFDLDAYWRFCANLSFHSKEEGTILFDRPYAPQRYFMHEVARALHDDIHDITCLKVRQLGISTAGLALDLYWPFTHEGLDGTIVTHDEDTQVAFRTQLTEYYDSLPKAWKPRKVAHNNIEFVFKFKSGTISRLQYQVAGTRKSGNSKLGRAKGNAYGHFTEVAFWGDALGMASLKNALAEKNPNRLYIWESTANGYNHFEEQWRIARKAQTQRAVFIGWWAHENYRIDRSTEQGENVFKVYWGSGGLNREERQLAHDVKLLYADAMQFCNGRTELSAEQFAWYRWYTEEKVADPEIAKQEMPWTEHQAFVVTGAQYFPSRELSQANKRVSSEPAPSYWRIEIRHTLRDCEIVVCPRKVSNLVLYAEPIEKAQYVLGADPAFGSSDWADRFVISVWRAYADRLEQVAEYATADCQPYAFAWCICYLAGLYAPCAWNLEVNGIGQTVLGEIDNLRRQQHVGMDEDRRIMKNFLGGMREFLYARPDQISRIPTARGTVSTTKEKTRYFATTKDYFLRDMLVVHSRDLLEEMRWITVEPGEAPKASGRKKDDRVIGACLACQMWHDKLRSRLMAQNITFARTEEDPAKPMTVVDRVAARHRALMGLSPYQGNPGLPRRR